MKANKKLLISKIETTYGVDSAPVVGTNDVLISNFTINPLNVRYAERNHALPYFGNRAQINVGDTMVMEYDIEMSGAGTVVGIPGYGVLMRGAGMSETVTPTTGPVTYAMISDNEESLSKYFYWDGVRHKMLGAYGSAEWRVSEGQIPYIHMRYEGLYSGVVEAAPGTPVLTAFQTPLAITKTNTVFTLHGYAAPLASLTITQGNEHVYKNRPNAERMYFTGRKMTGQVVIELPKPSVKDFLTICRNGTTGSLSMTHGVTAGNKCLLNASNVQLTNPQTSETDNLVMLTMNMNFVPSSAGNDEFTFATQ